MGVFFLIILLHCAKMISPASPIVYLVSARKQPVTHLLAVPQTKWSGEKDEPRTG